MQQGIAIDFIIENSEMLPITVNGKVGEVYLSKNLDEMDSTITWIDTESSLQFIVDAKLGKEDILKIAESVSREGTRK